MPTERLLRSPVEAPAKRERYPTIPIEKLRVDEETVFLFSGQGVQYVGMGQEIYDAYPDIVQPLYETADRILAQSPNPFSIKKMSFEGPEELLNRTEYAQLAILCYSQAYYRVLMHELQQAHGETVDPGAFGGPSSGGISALVADGASDFEDTFRFLQMRSPRMQKEGTDAKYKALWITSPHAFTVITTEFSDLEISYRNNQSNLIACGPEEVVVRDLPKLKALGIFPDVLDGYIPAHTKAMERVKPHVIDAFAKKPLKRARKPMYSNNDGRRIQEPEDLQHESITQLTATVNWEEAVNAMERDGRRKIVIIGKNPQLAKLTRRQWELSTEKKQKIVTLTSRKELVLGYVFVSEEDYLELAAA